MYLVQPRDLFTTLRLSTLSGITVVLCLARDPVCPLPAVCIERELDTASGRPWTG